jgi:hypothetical protein
MQLSEMLEKAGVDDIVRELTGFVAQRLMEQDDFAVRRRDAAGEFF